MSDEVKVDKVETHKSITEVMFDDYSEFMDRDGKKYYFVKFIKPRNLLAWDYVRKDGVNISGCQGVRVENVHMNVLKELKIWEQLTPEMQKTVEAQVFIANNEVQERMEKARAARKGKEELIGVPREVTCCKCGETQQVAPRQILLRSGKAFKSVEDWCKEYQCQKCNPTKGRKGRKANPLYATLPSELNCCKGCGAKMAIQPSSLIQRAKQKGKTIEEFIASWACQTCVPTKGRKKGAKNKKK